MSIDPSEPSVQWLNSTNNSTDVLFHFDGLCDVTVTCSPNTLMVSHTIDGTNLTVTISKMAGTSYSDYMITLLPYRYNRTWASITIDVFYGLEIINLSVGIPC